MQKYVLYFRRGFFLKSGPFRYRGKVGDLSLDDAEFQVQGDDVSDERPQKIYGEILYHIPIVPKGSGG